MYLNQYTVGIYNPGAPLWCQLLWYFIGTSLVESHWIPFSAPKVTLLKWFGANVGQGIRIKPGLKVKFPWRLSIGDYTWLGENLWIDNLAPVKIGDNVCISQGVYLCTGNHDWSSPSFDLKIAPIEIQSSAWIGAKSSIGPGVTIHRGAVLTLGSLANQSLNSMTIYSGNPAKEIKKRIINPE